MVAKPENREEAVRQLVSQSGGKHLAYYMTFGEHDSMVISEGYEGVATSAIVVAGGGVTDLKTALAMTVQGMQQAFTNAGPGAAHFKAAGALGSRAA